LVLKYREKSYHGFYAFCDCFSEIPEYGYGSSGGFRKTISNEIFMADLSKMPHLLMAGATGQGKSVGINAILTSLLYKNIQAN
jgi:hypothetical protein